MVYFIEYKDKIHLTAQIYGMCGRGYAVLNTLDIPKIDINNDVYITHFFFDKFFLHRKISASSAGKFIAANDKTVKHNLCYAICLDLFASSYLNSAKFEILSVYFTSTTIPPCSREY